jgi:hypothetical protein
VFLFYEPQEFFLMEIKEINNLLELPLDIGNINKIIEDLKKKESSVYFFSKQ